MVLKVCAFSIIIIIIPYRTQRALHVGMGFCTHSRVRRSRHRKKDILSSSSCCRKRRHSMGAEKSPISERPSHSAEPQPSLKGPESYQQDKGTHGQGTAGGLQTAGQPGEASPEHAVCCAGSACWIGRYTAFSKEKIKLKVGFFF